MKFLQYHTPEAQVVEWEYALSLLQDSPRTGSGADMPIEDIPIFF